MRPARRFLLPGLGCVAVAALATTLSSGAAGPEVAPAAALLAQAQPAPPRATAGAKPAPKPDQQPQPQSPAPEVARRDFTPKDWVAFVSVGETSLPRTLHVLETTPYFLVLRDGRVIWRDESRPLDPDKRDPEVWRVGKVDRAKLSDLGTLAAKLRFHTIQPTLDPSKPPVIITTGATPQLGVAVSPNQARIAPLLPAAQAGETYHTALRQVRDSILALKPAESTRYEPETIRVEVLAGPTGGGRAAVKWPLPSAPSPLPGQYLYYSGDNAKAVVSALASGTAVRMGERVVTVQWAPAIDVPIRLSAAK